ncbi:ABC transporter substrate-binding protein [Achromobacter xylosoxidans]
MKTRFKHCLAACALGAISLSTQAQVSDDVVKIGVLGDQSGMMADLSGKFGVEAVKMAVEDFGGTVLGKPIEVVSADHQNKVDIGVATARRWYENEKVDLILDVPNSAIALAVQDLTRQMKRVVIFTSAGSADLTGKACSPNGMHWTYDTYAYATGVASGVMEDGGKSWYFITSDYAFGHSLERDAMAVVKAKGGQVVGSVRHPIASADFSSFLLQAQASKAQVIGLANGSGDTINSIKQAFEFGIMGSKQRVAALFMSIVDVRSVGLEYAQGLNLVEPFYWDQDDKARQWSERYFKRTGRMPSMVQASNYSATMHYLNAIKAAGTDGSEAVIKKMHETPINDFMTENGRVREDGRVMRDLYLFQVKKPSESKRDWDYYKLVRKIPAEQAFRPLDQGGCALVKR